MPRVPNGRAKARSIALFASIAALTACSKDDAPKPSATIEASVVAAPSSSFPLSRRIAQNPFTAPHAPLADCRAIALIGNAAMRNVSNAIAADAGDAGSAGNSGSVVVSANGVLPEGKWIDLAPATALLTVKDPRTARETIYSGVTTVRPCVAHTEETWLPRGTLETSPGSGEAQATEEWVVTPAGVVRYTSATKAKVRVLANAVTIEVVGGIARTSFPGKGTLNAGGDGGSATLPKTDGEWTEIDSGATLEAHVTLDAAGAKEASDRCIVSANRAHDLAAQIESLVDRSTLGTLASAHASAVVVARAMCAAASLRVALLADGASKTDLGAKVAAADRAWRNAAP